MAAAVGGIWDHGAMSVASWLESAPLGAEVPPAELDALRVDLDLAVSAAIEPVADLLGPSLLPLRLPKSRLADLERCERSALARQRVVAPPTGAAVLRGTALDHFVAHQLVAGRVREPVADLASMLSAAADHETLAVLEQLDADEATSMLSALAAAVAEEWAGIDASWAPRTQSRATLLLGDGACSCAGVVDVELGGPGSSRPGVLIEVKSGSVAVSHPHEAYLYALLVALRDRAAPAVVARWYPGSDPTGLPVTMGVLEAAAARLVAGVRRWSALVVGDVPQERSGPWCAWCPDRTVCPSADSGGSDDDGG
jgi:hypothetical protein